jgi:quinol monooxygenase YgiN
MLIVAGRVQIKGEHRAEAVAAATAMARATRAEPGCRAYAFYADLEDADTFLIFELWDDEAALMAHFQTPHMAAFNAVIPQFVAAPPAIDRYEVAGVQKLM